MKGDPFTPVLVGPLIRRRGPVSGSEELLHNNAQACSKHLFRRSLASILPMGTEHKIPDLLIGMRQRSYSKLRQVIAQSVARAAPGGRLPPILVDCALRAE